MSLCIWTSLHLNLPEHKKEHLQKYRKLGWMILGLIAPEMVVWNAWSQRKEMSKVSRLMQEKGFMPVKCTLWKRVREGVLKAWHWTLTCLLFRAGDLPEFAEPTPYRRYNGRIHPWTDVHSWLAVMGGFSFEDSAEEDQQFMPENRQRINITIRVFQYMLEMRDHLIPDISREMILDKSKSDRLAKLLTCWQAGYFCIQCVYRLSQQLSITLLELNVFAHALCALALFVIWSDKPRDVCEPTLIGGDEANDICAIFCLSVVDGHHLNRVYYRGYEIISTPDRPENTLEIVQPTTFSCLHGSTLHLLYGALGHDTIKVLETHWVIGLSQYSHNYKKRLDVTQVTINARDLRRLQRVSNLVQRERIHFIGPKRIRPDNMPSPLKGRRLSRTMNWCMDTGNAVNMMTESGPAGSRRYRLRWLRFVAGLTFAGTCYGGLHLAAWKTPFASRAEAILWRAASVSIMAPGPLCVIVACLKYICYMINLSSRGRSTSSMESSRTYYFSRTEPSRSGSSGTGSLVTADSVAVNAVSVDSVTANSGTADSGTADSGPMDSRTDDSEVRRRTLSLRYRIMEWIEVILFFSFALWYITCRVFIVVESFIMLAHIPDRALQAPTWSAYIPHIV
jgi:hypothetical protein